MKELLVAFRFTTIQSEADLRREFRWTLANACNGEFIKEKEGDLEGDQEGDQESDQEGDLKGNLEGDLEGDLKGDQVYRFDFARQIFLERGL